MKMTCLLFAIVTILACNENDADTTCYSFDERQCHTDVWKDAANPPSSEASSISQLTAYLSDRNIEVADVTFDPNFYDAVCEACHVCPSGTRIFVKVRETGVTKMSDLDLLNSESADCNSIF
jgi:hypothetical protein